MKERFHSQILHISDLEQLVDNLVVKMRDQVTGKLKRFGGVVGLSGGIDSSVTMALAVRALGAKKVLGVMMPEKDSSPESRELGLMLAEQLKIETLTEDITSSLDGFACYQRRDKAVKEVISAYDPEIHKMKIGIKSSGIGTGLPPVFHITVINPDGSEIVERLPSKQFRTIMAASNFKQRSRMSFLYYHAERLHYAVIGTANKHEVEQGFFVKFGDGGCDMLPIGHLYKTQVYQVAEYLGIPREIRSRVPTTDTYTAEQTQEEFFYQFPFEELDLLWYGFEEDYPPGEVGEVMGKTENEIALIYKNFERKIETTEYLRMHPLKDLNS